MEHRNPAKHTGILEYWNNGWMDGMMGQELGRKFKKNFDQYSHIPLFHFPSIPLFHPSIGFTEFQEESFHPCDPQPLAYPPSFFPIPDAETFAVKPNFNGFNVPPGLNPTAKSFDGFMVVDQAEIRANPFHIDLDHLLLHARSLCRLPEE